MTLAANFRFLVPVALILAAIVSLFAISYTRVPEFTASTYSSTFVVTAVNEEVLVKYSYNNSSCSSGPSMGCIGQVFPYTTTEIWSAEITTTMPTFSTSTTYVPYAVKGGSGAIILLIGLVALLLGGILLLTRNRYA